MNGCDLYRCVTVGRRWPGVALCCCVISLLAWTLTDAAIADDPRPCVLELRNGDFVRGRIADSRDNVIGWSSEHFATPLQFDIAAVDAMKFAPTNDRAEIDGDHFLEFHNRDACYGNVLAINQDHVEIETEAFGNVLFRADTVKRIVRRGPAMQVYPVPTRLSDWTQSDAEYWRAEGNSFVTETPQASLFADVELPDKAMIELEFAWAKGPSGKSASFSIYLGTDQTAESRKQAFSIEFWDEFAIVQRQLEDDADLASLIKPAVQGSLHVFAYLDQQSGQLLLYDAAGKLLADLTVPAAGVKATGLMFLNRGGQFRLNYVQVRGWSGSKPTSTQADVVNIATGADNHVGSRVTLQDGRLSIAAPSEEADFAEESHLQVPWKQVTQVDFPVPDVVNQQQVVVGFRDGIRISGALTAAEEGFLYVQSPLTEQELRVPTHWVRGFAVQHADTKTDYPRTSPNGLRYGKVELMDTRLHGWLIENEDGQLNGASCLTWRAVMASNASPLVTNAFGRIVYRDPPKPVKPAPPRNVRNRRGAMVLGGFQGRIQDPPAAQPKMETTQSQQAVHLRSGDVIPGSVTKIDEAGIHIDSSTTETKLLKHGQVKAVQLIDNAPMPKLPRAKRERLLTLPRMQRNAPPMHLLFSKQGDVLRGSVVSLNDEELLMEVRLNPHPIPRDRVATVVWLHEDEMTGDVDELADVVEAPPDEQDRLMVQVAQNSGTRYSFWAESFRDQTVCGSSEILHSMQTPVNEIDQLLLGGFIRSNAKTLVYGSWHLSAAPDPKYVTASHEGTDDPATPPGMESLLVGKPAPDLKLKMLDEITNFQLSEHRGHCVVLDFWATWCGPCLQVMPVVEKVVAEFAEQDVRLFAVNLEERPAEIKQTLERRELNVNVVLDRDGVAATRYEARAIPQTVLIDSQGNVARVFVGNSRNFEADLRAAIAELAN